MNCENNQIFDINHLIKKLPHSYPLLLIDRVIEFIPFELIVSIKNISYNEWCFQGHFEDNPIYPGVLLIESIAQTSIILFQESYGNYESNKSWVLVGAKSRFFKPVIPGDQVHFECKPIKMLSNGTIILSATVLVDKFIVAKVELTVTKMMQKA